MQMLTRNDEIIQATDSIGICDCRKCETEIFDASSHSFRSRRRSLSFLRFIALILIAISPCPLLSFPFLTLDKPPLLKRSRVGIFPFISFTFLLLFERFLPFIEGRERSSQVSSTIRPFSELIMSWARWRRRSGGRGREGVSTSNRDAFRKR